MKLTATLLISALFITLAGCKKDDTTPSTGGTTGPANIQSDDIYAEFYSTTQAPSQLAFFDNPSGNNSVTVGQHELSTTGTYTLEVNNRSLSQMARPTQTPARAGNAIQHFELTKTSKNDTLAVVYNNKREMTRVFLASNSKPSVSTLFANSNPITEAQGRSMFTALKPMTVTQVR